MAHPSPLATPTAPPADAEPQAPAHLDAFSYDDKVCRLFMTAMFVWGLVAFLVGLILAIQLPFPTFGSFFDTINQFLGTSINRDLLKGIGLPGDMGTNFNREWFTFGRLRPLHTNAAIFAFAGNAIFAGVYYSTQRLCKTRMWSDTLSRLHFWGWQLIIVAAAVTLPMGITQGKEYAELEWPIDILIAVVWLGFFGVNFMMTLLRRRERHMYVALWFYIATIVTVTVLHVFNNLVVPVFGPNLVKSYPIYAGVQDAFMQWWYGHNAVAFFLTTPFLGMMYYFLPKAAERPVFSYRLSIVHFWSLVFIYIWAGPHHLQYTALPDWAATLGMVFSLMLWMPSWGGMLNFLLTLRGAWQKVASDPVLKFFVVAITFYGMATFEGPMLSIKSVNALSHYTDWTIAHVHSGALGWNGFLAFGMMYFLLPRLFQAKLYSVKIANTHFWLATVGILLYIVPIYVAGITQGLMWRAMTETGQLAYPEFIESVLASKGMWMLRIVGGGCYMAGAVIGGVNLVMTWKRRPKQYDEPVVHAAPLSRVYDGDLEKPAPTIDGVTDSAKAINVWATGWWHRRWERLPIRFTVWVVIAVVVASLFEIIPTFLIRSNVPQIESVRPYTALELYGRDIYVAEGCYNCHSQMIRPILSEVERYGEYSKPGEFIYDRPFQWGSRRIGPDLARVGVSRPQASWHAEHFYDPAGVIDGSIMPAYTWLYEREVDWGSLEKRMRAINLLHGGEAYTEEELNNAVADAEAQGLAIAAQIEADQGRPGLERQQIIALIAYMQRLGTDLNAPVLEEGVVPEGGVDPDPAGDGEPAPSAPADQTQGDG